MGLTTVEAMACGTPVVTSNLTAVPEVVREEGGVVAENLTAEDIVNKNYSQIEIPRKFDQQYILAMAWRYAKPEQVPAIREFISREFGEEILSVYDGARALVTKNIKSDLEK